MVEKVYEILDELDNSEFIKKLKTIKKSIINDDNIMKLINDFKLAKENYEKYNLKEEFLEAKRKMLENEIIKEYVDIQNKINMLTLKINERIGNITRSTRYKK